VKRTKRTFLELETLEDRWVPANVTFVSGFLIIGPSSGEPALNLTVTQSATTANTFTVKDGTSTLGTFIFPSRNYLGLMLTHRPV
jgi:hypothetical protein